MTAWSLSAPSTTTASATRDTTRMPALWRRGLSLSAGQALPKKATRACCLGPSSDSGDDAPKRQARLSPEVFWASGRPKRLHPSPAAATAGRVPSHGGGPNSAIRWATRTAVLALTASAAIASCEYLLRDVVLCRQVQGSIYRAVLMERPGRRQTRLKESCTAPCGTMGRRRFMLDRSTVRRAAAPFANDMVIRKIGAVVFAGATGKSSAFACCNWIEWYSQKKECYVSKWITSSFHCITCLIVSICHASA